MIALAEGTDLGGSLRIPASFCGVVGLKPTYGRISRAGIFPLSWSNDHAGPLTRTVADAALALQALSGFDAADPGSSRHPPPNFSRGLTAGVKGLRLGVPREFFWDEVDAEVAEGDDEHPSSLMDYLGEVDPALSRLEDRHTVQGALASLPDRHREVLKMRYYDGLSQAEIARRLGISQMHVSRIQRDALKRLRAMIEA